MKDDDETHPLTSRDLQKTYGSSMAENTATEQGGKDEASDLGMWIRNNISETCDTYGKIAFQGITRKSMAKFIRLPIPDVNERFDDIYKLVTEKWDVEPPRLIVSVTGGAKNFDIENEVLTNFKDIALKISQTPGAWVITGGTHAGVMRHVGDALREESTAVCVGIPTYGIITGREKLNPQDLSSGRMFPYHVGAWLNAKGAYLDPNHTHFLLIDDGSTGRFGREIKFRADFEKHLIKQYDVPFVLLVLNGGVGTFDTIYETVTGGFPVVLIKGSGRVADLFADMITEEKDWEKTHEDLIAELMRLDNDFDNKWKTCVEKKEMGLYIVAVNEENSSIMDSVMNALLCRGEESITYSVEYLRMALLWDNPDILRKMLPVNKPEQFVTAIFKELDNLLVMAMARGNLNFVRLLLLEYEVDIQEVLTMDVLELLYGYQSHEKNFLFTSAVTYSDYNSAGKDKEEAKSYVKDIYQYSSNWNFGDGKCTLNVNGVHKLRAMFFGGIIDEELTSLTLAEPIQDPLWELFIWATVCNLPDLATFFLPFEGDQIAKSLIAYKFWKELAEDETRYDDQKISSFRESEVTFKSFANELLNQCYQKDEKEATKLITTTIKQIPNKTCIELAVESENYEFVAHNCVQNALTDVWTGKLHLRDVTMKDYLKILIAICLPFLIGRWYQFQELDDTPEGSKYDSHQSTSNATGKRSRTGRVWIYLKYFYCNTPVVGFLLHFVLFIFFLCLYSYVTLTERSRERSHVTIYSLEILLFVMVLGHLTTELYQITQYDDDTAGKKLSRWISDIFNMYDAFNLTLFIIAFGLRFSENYSEAHTIHAVNCGFWIVRITSTLRVSSTLGQYLEMVQLMLNDLINFLLLFVFAILAYGVLSASLLYPEGPTAQQILTTVMRPLFHIYGDNFIDMQAPDSSSTRFSTPKYNEYDEYVVWIFFSIYLAVTNILLLNIIIAIFNNTYEAVKSKGTSLWKFKRYDLIVEYSKRISAPPPLSIIFHTYLLLRWIVYSTCGASTNKSSDSEIKRSLNSLSTEEKVQLTQLECDCAMIVQKQLTESEVVETFEGLGGDAKEGRAERSENDVSGVDEMKMAIEGLKEDMDDMKVMINGIHEFFTK